MEAADLWTVGGNGIFWEEARNPHQKPPTRTNLLLVAGPGHANAGRGRSRRMQMTGLDELSIDYRPCLMEMPWKSQSPAASSLASCYSVPFVLFFSFFFFSVFFFVPSPRFRSQVMERNRCRFDKYSSVAQIKIRR